MARDLRTELDSNFDFNIFRVSSNEFVNLEGALGSVDTLLKDFIVSKSEYEKLG